MAEPAPFHSGQPTVEVAHLITEDDAPVDNFFQDKQANLLTDALDASWPEGRPYVSAADVGIFATNLESCPLVVPDVLLSTGVSLPEETAGGDDKERRSYYMWLFGKPPEVVVEIVSNREGGEEGEKLLRYSRIKVPYYVVYDRHQLLGSRPLRIRQLSGASYVDKVDQWFPEVGLGLRTWTGEFDGLAATWLRWCRQDGSLLLTGKELAQAERQRADNERERADSERQRVEALEARLRELGLDP